MYFFLNLWADSCCWNFIVFYVLKNYVKDLELCSLTNFCSHFARNCSTGTFYSSHFVPQHSGQIQFSVGTNANLPFFQVHIPEFEYSTCARVLMCSKWNIGTWSMFPVSERCTIHFVLVSSAGTPSVNTV